jgi:hypothetical protein
MKDFTAIISSCKFGQLTIAEANKMINEQLDNQIEKLNKLSSDGFDRLIKVPIKSADFKKMPNDEEFYFCIDLAYNKRVHRCGHIKAHPDNFTYVFLYKSQL